MTESGAGWPEYRLEVFGDPYLVWHEGADFAPLLRLSGAEREFAVGMLEAGLREGDPIAAEGLRELGAVQAVALLREVVNGGEPRFRIRVAQALCSLTGEQDWSRTVAEVLDSPAFWGERIHAALALRDFTPTPELIACLARAVDDEEYLVRYHAASTLLAYAGRKPDVASYKRWYRRLTDEDRAVWPSVAEEVAAVAASPPSHEESH